MSRSNSIQKRVLQLPTRVKGHPDYRTSRRIRYVASHQDKSQLMGCRYCGMLSAMMVYLSDPRTGNASRRSQKGTQTKKRSERERSSTNHNCFAHITALVSVSTRCGVSAVSRISFKILIRWADPQTIRSLNQATNGWDSTGKTARISFSPGRAIFPPQLLHPLIGPLPPAILGPALVCHYENPPYWRAHWISLASSLQV